MPRQRHPLVFGIEDRDGTRAKDARLINCVVEIPEPHSPRVRTRPGTSNVFSVTAAAGRGSYSWNNNHYAVFGNTLYKNGVALTGSIAGTDICSFVSTRGGTPYLVVHSTAAAYYVTAADVITQITSAGYPAATVHGVAYLDGYVCVMDSGARIYQSAIDDPSTWTGDYITADVEPSDGVALLSHISYIIALKQYSVEFEYDAANATGSPFSRFSGARVSFGCAFGNSVAQGDGLFVWVAQSRIGGLFVASMSGMKARTISTSPVDKILQSESWEDAIGMLLRTSGHLLYVLTLYTTAYANAVTLVFDFNSDLWYEWKSGGSYFPYLSNAYENDKAAIQHMTNGNIDYIGDEYADDNGTPITCDAYTPIWDANEINRKFIARATLIGDLQGTSTINLSFSDDDFQTESIQYPLDMSTERPFVAGLGSAYRRSFHLNWQGNNRLAGIELDFRVAP